MADITSNLVGHWQLDGDLTAEVGDAQTALDGTVTYESGVSGQAGVFDGSTATKTAAAFPGLDETSPQTISCWVKSSSVGLFRYAVSNRDGSVGGMSIVLNNDNTASVYIGSTDEAKGSAVISDGQWHFVAITYDGGGSGASTVSVYVDGLLDNSVSSGTFTWTDTEELFLGARGDGAGSSSFRLTGSLDDVRIYSRELSYSDIVNLYQTTRLKPSLTLHHDLSASAIDSNLTSYAGRVASNNFSASEVAAIFAADSGSGADVWFSSDASGATPIDAKLLYWSDGDSVFAFDVAIASASSSTGATVYLQVGNKPSGYGTDPYPATMDHLLPLASNTNDVSSNARSATENGGITAGSLTGPDGNVPATDFDGLDDNLNLSGDAVAYVNGSAYTVSLWVDPDQYDDLNVLRTTGGSTALSLKPNLDTGSAGFHWLQSGATAVSDGGGDRSGSGWYHIAASYANSGAGEVILYVNGGQAAIDSSVGNANTGATQLYVGGSTLFYDGGVSNYRADTTIRPAAEINADYLLQGSSASTYWTVTDISSSDPLGDKSIELGASHVYVFDEASGKLLDRVGSNDGTASGTPTYRESDQRGLPSAIGFDGSTDYFTLAGNMLNGASAYTVELLAKFDSFASANNVFCERDAATDGVRLDTSSTTLRWRHNAVTLSGSATLETGVWYHIHAVWDGADITLYLDGSSIGSASVATAIATTIAAKIGDASFAPGSKFGGDISHVAIYPRALTATEVGELYDVGLLGNGLLLSRLNYGLGLNLGLGL